MTRNDTIRKLAIIQGENVEQMEFDSDAKISEGDDNGAYVQAWVWVPFAGTELDKEKDEVAK